MKNYKQLNKFTEIKQYSKQLLVIFSTSCYLFSENNPVYSELEQEHLNLAEYLKWLCEGQLRGDHQP